MITIDADDPMLQEEQIEDRDLEAENAMVLQTAAATWFHVMGRWV